jgi:hypothetical protein
MNHYARSEAQKRIHDNMTNAEANTAAVVADQGATVAPEKAFSKKGASQKKGAPKGRKAATGNKTNAAAPKKQAKADKKAPKAANTPRAESKGAKILELIERPKGATLAEIIKVVSWQAHSVRGYLSTAAKKHRVKIESAKNDAGGRTYRIT